MEKKPKEHPVIPRNGYIPNNYAKQMRPRSAYVAYKKPTQSSSTLNSSLQSSNLSNQLMPKQHKQLKTKQNLYMNLINPKPVRDPKFGMTVPSRIRTPMDYHQPSRTPKANTLPRYSAANGKRLRVNHKHYMDMIRPIMASPQYLKLGATTRSTPPLSLTQRTLSRQSQPQNTRMKPRPPSNGQIFRQLDPNSGTHGYQCKGSYQRREYSKGDDTPVSSQQSTSQRHVMKGTHNSSLSNSISSSSHSRDVHLPRIVRKTKDDVSLNSSLNSRSQIPSTHPDNIKPLYFRKSLAYSPSYERKPLSRPLSSMNT